MHTPASKPAFLRQTEQPCSAIQLCSEKVWFPPCWHTTWWVWRHESSSGTHVALAPSPLGRTDVNPRASVTQANWIWPAAGALNVHFGGGREGGQRGEKPALCLLLVLRCLGRKRGLWAEEGLGQGCCFARGSFPDLMAEMQYREANMQEPGWSCLSFYCIRWICVCLCVCVLLCFSALCILAIIPFKVTEISFVRQADRALSYYGIT